MAQRVVIGVTGHRTLDHSSELSSQVRGVLSEINRMAGEATRREAPVSKELVILRALSPIAEGADRLVAHEVLRFPAGELDVVLPLMRAEYRTDFKTPESRREYRQLLARARRVVELPPAASRSAAYLAVGQYVVDHSDVVIALWNGQPPQGEGGTADIVDYARKKRVPLFWICSSSPKTPAVFEPGRGFAPRAATNTS